MGWGRPHQVSVPPGFCRVLGLVPVQGEAEVLLLRDVQDQVHSVTLCRHVEPWQGCGGAKKRQTPSLLCTPKPGPYSPTDPLEFPSNSLGREAPGGQSLCPQQPGTKPMQAPVWVLRPPFPLTLPLQPEGYCNHCKINNSPLLRSL